MKEKARPFRSKPFTVTHFLAHFLLSKKLIFKNEMAKFIADRGWREGDKNGK
jgi:hypothetical protein